MVSDTKARACVGLLLFDRSQWPRGQWRRSADARLLRSWARIPLGAWMSVCCECCVLSDRGLCDNLITRPEESYRLWCVVLCDIETSSMRSQTSIVIELKYEIYHWMYLLHVINSDRQHNCWMSSDWLQYVLLGEKNAVSKKQKLSQTRNLLFKLRVLELCNFVEFATLQVPLLKLNWKGGKIVRNWNYLQHSVVVISNECGVSVQIAAWIFT